MYNIRYKDHNHLPIFSYFLNYYHIQSQPHNNHSDSSKNQHPATIISISNDCVNKNDY